MAIIRYSNHTVGRNTAIAGDANLPAAPLSIPKTGVAIFAVAVLLLVGFIQNAYMSSAGGPAGPAGAGSGSISGYVVSKISYQSSSSDPHLLGSVSFELDHPATRVTALVDDMRLICVVVDREATCDAGTAAPTIASITRLSVIASA